MNKIHTHLIGKTEIKPLNFCGKEIGWQMQSEGGFYIIPYDVEPTKGEHDFKTCEGCQKSLKEFTKQFYERYTGKGQKKGFPLCCSYHSNLINIKEFDKAAFEKVPEMAARKIIYTNQHIINNKSFENWYKIITDYIEYVYKSFGQMPTGCGEGLFLSAYFYYVIENLEKQEKGKYLDPEKKEKILEFINLYRIPAKEQMTDLNILIGTYQNWFKVFPFELNSYFGNLKTHFEKQLPILKGKVETNMYSGMTKGKVHTKNSLIEALITLTDNLLTQINGVVLYENGLITDTNKLKLELVINSRKLKLKNGYNNSSPNEEQRYRKILKDWFKDEKKFIDEITPLLKVLPCPPTETKTDKLRTILSKYGFFDLPKVKQLSEPNKQSLIELISTNGLPYSIAMFDFLDFLKHIENEYFKTKYKLNKEVAKWFNSDKDGRAVKGNISSLSDYSTENKSKYTAHTHKETVKTDYQKLK